MSYISPRPEQSDDNEIALLQSLDSLAISGPSQAVRKASTTTVENVDIDAGMAQWGLITGILSSQSDLQTALDLKADSLDLTNLYKAPFRFKVDGQGAVITTGNKGVCWIAPYNCTITGWTLLSANNISGSIVVDIWKDSYGNYPPTVVDTIFGTKPALSSQTKNQSSGLTIPVNEGDIFYCNIDSTSAVTMVVLNFNLTIQ